MRLAPGMEIRGLPGSLTKKHILTLHTGKPTALVVFFDKSTQRFCDARPITRGQEVRPYYNVHRFFSVVFWEFTRETTFAPYKYRTTEKERSTSIRCPLVLSCSSRNQPRSSTPACTCTILYSYHTGTALRAFRVGNHFFEVIEAHTSTRFLFTK